MDSFLNQRMVAGSNPTIPTGIYKSEKVKPPSYLIAAANLLHTPWNLWTQWNLWTIFSL